MSPEHYAHIAPATEAPAGLAARRTAVILGYLLLGAITLSPLLQVRVPPLVDYPDHLARMWILSHGDIPALAANYVAAWRLLPNLAMDLIVPVAAKLMPLELAGRAFIALSMTLPVMATMALQRAFHGRVGLWPLASLLFVYNAVLFVGLLNYLFSLGLALLLFAAWVSSEQWPTGRRVALFSVPAALLFVFHLFALGVYGLLVTAYECGNRLLPARRSESAGAIAVRLLQFIPAALLWFASLSQGGPRYTAYGRLSYKLYAAAAPTTFGPVPTALDAAMLVGALVFLLHALHIRALRFAPAARAPIIALLVAAALMPNWLMGSWLADIRVPVALAFVTVGAAQFDPGRRRGTTALWALAALALLGARVWTVSQSWRDMDRLHAEFRGATSVLPEGARLLVAQSAMPDAAHRIPGVPAAFAERQPPLFWHVPELAIIDRAAFVPHLFTGWTPVRPTTRNAGRFQSQGVPTTPEMLARSITPGGDGASSTPDYAGELPYWRDWPTKFDLALIIDFGTPLPSGLDMLKPVASGSFFHIYRIAAP